MSEPLVSIIVRTKDRPKLLKRALRSIFAQTYRPLEVILVNDGGCDLDIDEIGHILGNVSLNYIRLETNTGRAHAGNIGLRNAQGKYLGFLDDDDSFYPDHIATLLSILEGWDFEVAYSDVDISVVDFDREDIKLAVKEKRTFSSKDFLFSELIIDNYIPLMSILFSSRIFSNGDGFDEHFELYEDWDLLIRIAGRFPFYHVKKTTAEYLQWSSSHQIAQTTESSEKVHSAHNQIIAKHRDKYTLDIIRGLVTNRRALLAAEKSNEELKETLRENKAMVEATLRENKAMVEATLRENKAMVEATLREKEGMISGLETTLSEKEGIITSLDNTLRIKETSLRDLEDMRTGLEKALQDKEAVLDRIYNSHGWKFLLSYYGIRESLLPRHSKRRVLAKMVFKALSNPARIFRRLSVMNLKKFFYYLRHADASVLEYKIDRKLSGDEPPDANGQALNVGMALTAAECPAEPNSVLLIGGLRSKTGGGLSDWEAAFVDHLSSLDYIISGMNDEDDEEEFFRTNGARFSFVIGSGRDTCHKHFPLVRAYAPQSWLLYVDLSSDDGVIAAELSNALVADGVIVDSDERHKRLVQENSALNVKLVRNDSGMRNAIGGMMTEFRGKKVAGEYIPEETYGTSDNAGDRLFDDGNNPGSEYGDAGGGSVLIAGIYLSDKKNAIEHIFDNLSQSKNFRVVQRWAALGGEAPSAKIDAVTVLKSRESIPKMMLLNKILSGEDIEKYDYVMICDDDVILPDNFVDDFFGLQRRYDFAAAQPARTHNSYLDHFIVERLDGLKARQTRFVEIGPVISFRRDIIPLIFPFDQSSPMGWGFDFVLPCIAEEHGMRIGIIDATPVDHSMRKPMKHYNYDDAKSAMNAYLAANPHLSIEEAFTIVEAYA